MWKLVSRSKLSNHKSNCVTPLVKTLQWPPPISIRIKSKVLIVPCKALVAVAKLPDLISLPPLSPSFPPSPSLFQNSAAKVAFFLSFFAKPVPITEALHPMVPWLVIFSFQIFALCENRVISALLHYLCPALFLAHNQCPVIFINWLLVNELNE